MRMPRCISASLFVLAVFAVSCAPMHRQGMVTDPETGLQWGSVVERNIVIDSSQFENRNIKVVIRNISGNPDFNLRHFRTQIEHSFESKGYIPTDADDFGLLFNVTTLYSGQIQKNMAMEYSFLGGSAGGIVGYRADTRAGTATGILAGATLGAIIGSYVTEETYISVVEVTIAVPPSRDFSQQKTITFGASPKLQDDPSERYERDITRFREVIRNKIAVFAGGRNITQRQIAEGVRQRLLGIITDII